MREALHGERAVRVRWHSLAWDGAGAPGGPPQRLSAARGAPDAVPRSGAGFDPDGSFGNASAITVGGRVSSGDRASACARLRSARYRVARSVRAFGFFER